MRYINKESMIYRTINDISSFSTDEFFTIIVLLVEPVPTAGTSLSQLKCKRTYTPA